MMTRSWNTSLEGMAASAGATLLPIESFFLDESHEAVQAELRAMGEGQACAGG